MSNGVPPTSASTLAATIPTMKAAVAVGHAS
jgi:hypothetical protein